MLYSGSCVRSAPTARITTAHVEGQVMCTVVPEFKIRKTQQCVALIQRNAIEGQDQRDDSSRRLAYQKYQNLLDAGALLLPGRVMFRPLVGCQQL